MRARGCVSGGGFTVVMATVGLIFEYIGMCCVVVVVVVVAAAAEFWGASSGPSGLLYKHTVCTTT